jgi:hypothetical protein
VVAPEDSGANDSDTDPIRHLNHPVQIEGHFLFRNLRSMAWERGIRLVDGRVLPCAVL